MKNKLKVKRCRSLSKYDQNVLLPILMKGLENKKGKANAVTSKQIIQAVRDHGLKINYRSFNMLINYIRMNDLIVGLLGSSTGYYISNNEQDFINYEDSLLGREVALRKVRMTMQRQRRTMYAQIPERQAQLF